MNKIKKYLFSELYEMSSGISSTKDQAGHGAPFLSFSTVFNNYFLPKKLKDKMNTTSKEQETFSIKKGDIFVTRTSETIDELAMSCVALKDYPNATYSGFVKRLRPKTSGIVDDKFIAFYLRSKLFRKTMENNATMTLRASFNEDIFSFLSLYLPPYKEQVKIGKLLYSIEEKIQYNKKINDNLVAVGTASIQKNVGRGALINLTEAEMDSLIFPEDFKIKTVSEFCAETKSGSTPSRTNNEYWENGTISWVKSGEVHNNITLQTEEYITPLGLSESSTKLLPKDTVLMAMYGVTAGEVGYLAIEATTNQAICGMICRSKAEAAYLYFSLIQSQAAISRLSNGGAQDNLSKNFIDNIKIVVPPSDFIEKLNLAAIVEQMTLNTKEITLLEELEATVLAQLSSR